jgi:hypothetical protein
MTSNQSDAEKVKMLISSPVVSSDSTSEESQLARLSKQIEVQASADSQYDLVVERFMNQQQPISIPLMGTFVALALFAASMFVKSRS